MCLSMLKAMEIEDSEGEMEEERELEFNQDEEMVNLPEEWSYLCLEKPEGDICTEPKVVMARFEKTDGGDQQGMGVEEINKGSLESINPVKNQNGTDKDTNKENKAPRDKKRNK